MRVSVIIFLALAIPSMAGEFVKRALGRDENGKPIYQYVYQAGSTRYARAAQPMRYGYGYGYHYPRSYVIRRTPRWHPHPRRISSTTRYRAPRTSTPRRRR